MSEYRAATIVETEAHDDPKQQLISLVHDFARAQGTVHIVGGNAHLAIPFGESTVLSKGMLDLLGLDHTKEPPPPPPQLDQLQLDTGIIVFSGGVPVGGYSHLSLFPNGAFSFTGHFHVSGAPSYDVSMVWVLKVSSGAVYTFAHSGRVHGTFESGSRSNDWGDSGTNPALAAAWADISNGYTFQWNAGADVDLGALIDQAVKIIGQIGTVVTVITKIVG